MREIKFRAWDSGNKKMVIVKDIVFLEDGVLAGYKTIGGLDLTINKPEIMQYTGLKDKNGKEIYEGDIVESGNGRIWTVQFGEFFYTEPKQLVRGYGFYIQPVEEELKREGNGFLYKGVEIIGNIYENPELLK